MRGGALRLQAFSYNNNLASGFHSSAASVAGLKRVRRIFQVFSRIQIHISETTVAHRPEGVNIIINFIMQTPSHTSLHIA